MEEKVQDAVYYTQKIIFIIFVNTKLLNQNIKLLLTLQ